MIDFPLPPPPPLAMTYTDKIQVLGSSLESDKAEVGDSKQAIYLQDIIKQMAQKN